MQHNLVVGMLAHVDAGKTTLAEGMLFRGGSLKRLGRVDHRDAFLDTEEMERRRGITIFSKQALLELDGRTLTLLDTPGHVDFAAEMERTLPVLDYAVLVISGTDGIQGHTATLWKLLERYSIPTFLFVNKMDLAGADPSALLAELRGRLHTACIPFGGGPPIEKAALHEEIALCDEAALEEFVERGEVDDDTVADLIRRRRIFPCYFGAALKLQGVDMLLEGLARYTYLPIYSDAFGARVFKITRDAGNNRLTHLKITGGQLSVKATLSGRRPDRPEQSEWSEKINAIRIYSGEKYTAVEKAPAGTVCAVTGLSWTYPGQGLGAEPSAAPPALEPVLAYRVLLPEGCNPHTALGHLRILEEEDPQLTVTWNAQKGEIHLRLMGEVQMEILRHLIRERFGLEVEFDAGSILYRETITHPVVGMGHFEPLRHYAEVHLLLEPAPRGSGLQFATACSEDVLPRHWQRLVLTHLGEREHPGVLTGAPITDLRITLLTGRAHNKHTEGGDFRQATYRAVRQGLMQADCVLLEPQFQFELEVPDSAVGRAMTDLQRMTEDLALPASEGGRTLLTGSAPVAALRDYAAEVTAYTRGLGRLTCAFAGFAPCHNQEAAVAASGYNAERDTENPADSIFCAHGAGFGVRWDAVKEYMHLDSGLPTDSSKPLIGKQAAEAYREEGGDPAALDAELAAIYERTYGPVRRREAQAQPVVIHSKDADAANRPPEKPRPEDPDFLLVDGYNIIHAWKDLGAVARENLDAARQMLLDILSNYRGYRGREIILVFDAYKVPGREREVSRYHGVHVVYTKEAETADAYIERVSYHMAGTHRVTVATSDGAVQMIIAGHGALRITPQALREEMERTDAEILAIIRQNNRHRFSPSIELPE